MRKSAGMPIRGREVPWTAEGGRARAVLVATLPPPGPASALLPTARRGTGGQRHLARGPASSRAAPSPGNGQASEVEMCRFPLFRINR